MGTGTLQATPSVSTATLLITRECDLTLSQSSSKVSTHEPIAGREDRNEYRDWETNSDDY